MALELPLRGLEKELQLWNTEYEQSRAFEGFKTWLCGSVVEAEEVIETRKRKRTVMRPSCKNRLSC